MSVVRRNPFRKIRDLSNYESPIECNKSPMINSAKKKRKTAPPTTEINETISVFPEDFLLNDTLDIRTPTYRRSKRYSLIKTNENKGQSESEAQKNTETCKTNFSRDSVIIISNTDEENQVSSTNRLGLRIDPEIIVIEPPKKKQKKKKNKGKPKPKVMTVKERKRMANMRAQQRKNKVSSSQLPAASSCEVDESVIIIDLDETENNTPETVPKTNPKTREEIAVVWASEIVPSEQPPDSEPCTETRKDKDPKPCSSRPEAGASAISQHFLNEHRTRLAETNFARQNVNSCNTEMQRNFRPLREIVVDGSNVARAHKNDKNLSVRGIELVVDYFRSRGHVVKVFLPNHVRRPYLKMLERMHEAGIVVFTPSRKIGGMRITPYDDNFILEYATMRGGIVISQDQYRDLYDEKPEWRDTIVNRLLAPTFVGDVLMFPKDPLGKRGPALDDFLRH